MRIAVCDDNSIDLKAMREVFRRVAPAHTLDTFSEGSKLLDAISGGRSYDLLFLDIIMPEITGMELARKIGMIAPDTPVVFLTDSDAYGVEAFSVRALHYVIKPITEQSLKECLNRVEERRSARRAPGGGSISSVPPAFSICFSLMSCSMPNVTRIITICT